ncbi:hypothetical protein ACFQY5_03700 [Paeniroseomonas aquatica]|uniref:Uncharacterized protein n=1 Tax=Paeniroseomonas aquatica TaxID=373043 RepID=A0ABT8ADC9_9PROT|nr:hypothetical protein [Paeniroseomonas aquatica]MDN3567670.1 hypothetical protein [Paeniroseomonas aquatica]
MTTTEAGRRSPEGEAAPGPTTADTAAGSGSGPAATAAPDRASWSSQVAQYLRANPGLLAPGSGAGRS